MKPEKISDAIGLIDEELITSAQTVRTRRKKRRRLVRGLAAAAVSLCLITAGVLSGIKGPEDKGVEYVYAIAEAEYPTMTPYPDEMAFVDEKTGEIDYDAYQEQFENWWESRRARMEPIAGEDGLDGFWTATMRQFLSDANGENRVYSPLNIYMALSMLAELTDGNSRGQILELLGADSIEKLRTQASAIWNASYCRDGAVTSVLANSLWLNEGVDFERSVMDMLAENYYASSYQGKMGSSDFNKMLQSWLNDQTGDLLKEQAEGIGFDTDTILALASTVYFQARWYDEFLPQNTKEGTFHAEGGDMVCEFMHQTNIQSYYWGGKFSAMAKGLEDAGDMWLILPDEGVTIDDLLLDDELSEMMLAGGEWKNNSFTQINLSMPKFDAASDLDIIKGLENLGITDIFDAEISDFSSMTKETDEIYVSEAEHAARVVVDEEGCTAAAFTVMEASGSGMPEDEVDFVLDRPFLFAITNDAGFPLFIGIVNQPV